MMNKKRTLQGLALSHVPRWGIVDTFKDQTVADHSFRTTILSMDILDWLRLNYGDVEVPQTGEVIEWAITHDIEEAISGDLPSPYKRSKDISEKGEGADLIDHKVLAIVKIADLVEAQIFVNRYTQDNARSRRIYDTLHKDLEEQVQYLYLMFDFPADAIPTAGAFTHYLKRLVAAGSNEV